MTGDTLELVIYYGNSSWLGMNLRARCIVRPPSLGVEFGVLESREGSGGGRRGILPDAGALGTLGRLGRRLGRGSLVLLLQSRVPRSVAAVKTAAGRTAAAKAKWEGGGSGNLVDRHGSGSHGRGRTVVAGEARSLAGTERAALRLLRQNGRLGPLWTLAAFSKGRGRHSSACNTTEDAYSCEEDVDLHCLVLGGLFELSSECNFQTHG